EDGATHQCIDYVGLLRNTFGWKLVVPADPNQTDRVVRWALSTGGNVCVAMGRSKVPVIVRKDGSPFFADDYTFRYGATELLRDGSDGAILAMGTMVYRAVEAWEKLRASGYSLKVYSVSCPLELDDSALADAAKTGLVVTYEDHHVRSGMGSLVAFRLAEMGITPPVFKALGVHRYGDSGAAPEVLSAMGLSVEHLVEAIGELMVQG
ncbi:MAG: transketolase, partial [Synergistales bacterium]|nr:transketolase [Synergistales bacterium]